MSYASIVDIRGAGRMRAIATIGLGLAAALSSAPISAKEPRSVDLTAKSVSELAGCIALKLTETSGYEVQKTVDAAATEIRLKFRVMGVAATAATFRVEDLGANRQLTIYATGKETGAPRMIAANVRRCATE
jgi:hypothetical protein